MLHLEDTLRARALCGRVRADYADPDAVTCRACKSRLTFFRGVRGLLIERGAWQLTPGALALDTRCGRMIVNTTTALYGWIACRFTEPEKTGHKGIVAQQGMQNHHYGVAVDFDPQECRDRFERWLDALCPPEGWAPTHGVS